MWRGRAIRQPGERLGFTGVSSTDTLPRVFGLAHQGAAQHRLSLPVPTFGGHPQPMQGHRVARRHGVTAALQRMFPPSIMNS